MEEVQSTVIFVEEKSDNNRNYKVQSTGIFNNLYL